MRCVWSRAVVASVQCRIVCVCVCSPCCVQYFGVLCGLAFCALRCVPAGQKQTRTIHEIFQTSPRGDAKEVYVCQKPKGRTSVTSKNPGFRRRPEPAHFLIFTLCGCPSTKILKTKCENAKKMEIKEGKKGRVRADMLVKRTLRGGPEKVHVRFFEKVYVRFSSKSEVSLGEICLKNKLSRVSSSEWSHPTLI